MNRQELEEILRYFPKYRKRFDYFKDRYALLLLQLATQGEVHKHELKASPYARLLQKTVVRETLALFSGKALSAEDFGWYWPQESRCYYLTLGTWGSKDRFFDQTSRAGRNLVLQLNFSNEHDARYKHLVDPSGEQPFALYCHPVRRRSLNTLAWSRIDVDLASGEALIEEIQNDWIRIAHRVYRRTQRSTWHSVYCYGHRMDRLKFREYVETVLAGHVALWDEAMLSATLWFLRSELGIRKVYYHTHETGAAMKHISHTLPPRSLYTKLPRRFCFTETDEAPAVLKRKSRSLVMRRKLDAAKFHTLSL